MASNAGGTLARRLGTADAVTIGLGSMIGAGVFAAFTPAARSAGAGLLLGLLIAAFVAYCNATSSAQLAAAYPSSGGTYLYGRKQLGEWPGFLQVRDTRRAAQPWPSPSPRISHLQAGNGPLP